MICNNCGEDLRRRSPWGGWWVHEDGREWCTDGDGGGSADPVCMVCGRPPSGLPGMRCECESS